MADFRSTTKSSILKVMGDTTKNFNDEQMYLINRLKLFLYDCSDTISEIRDISDESCLPEFFCQTEKIDNETMYIWFDISEIKRRISVHQITTPIVNSHSRKIKDNYTYTKTDLRVVKQDKDTLAILVYLPTLVEQQIKSYLVIDGNHRITYYEYLKKDFNAYVLKPFDLELSCFRDFHSFILYHFHIVLFYMNILNSSELDNFILEYKDFFNRQIVYILQKFDEEFGQ